MSDESKVYLLHYFSAGDFTHKYGAEQRLYRVGAVTFDDAAQHVPARKAEFERDTNLHVGAVRIYQIADEMEFDLSTLLAKQREARERAEYERLKAKFERSQS